MGKFSSFALALAAALTLVATPVLAQNAPMGDMKGNMSDMKTAKPAMAKKAMKHAPMKHAAMRHSAMKHTCTDYAWQSQDQKDCEAGTKKPPMGRS